MGISLSLPKQKCSIFVVKEKKKQMFCSWQDQMLIELLELCMHDVCVCGTPKKPSNLPHKNNKSNIRILSTHISVY